MLARGLSRLARFPAPFAVLAMPREARFATVPRARKRPNASDVLPLPLCTLVVPVLSPVLKVGEALQVLGVVVERVAVLVVHMMPLGNRAVVVLPHCSVEPLTSASEVVVAQLKPRRLRVPAIRDPVEGDGFDA